MHILVVYISILVQQLPRHTMKSYKGFQTMGCMRWILSFHSSANIVYPIKYSRYALAQHIIRMDESALVTENLERRHSNLTKCPRIIPNLSCAFSGGTPSNLTSISSALVILWGDGHFIKCHVESICFWLPPFHKAEIKTRLEFQYKMFFNDCNPDCQI